MEKIIVVGGGTMGAGIACVAALAGFAVDLIEPDTRALDAARAKIAKDARRANASQNAGPVNYYAALQSGTQALAAIEAVPERLDLKREVFRSLRATVNSDCLLATNTSSLSVGDIAAGIDAGERIVGLHFFNPPPMMKLVEIVRGAQTSDAAISQARSLVERLGKTPVVTADTPGFIVNRVARPYYLQSLRALEAGLAPIEDLDRLARGAGFRMGPFELMDLIGLDVNLATTESIYERTEAARLEPVQVQRSMVASNRLGRKTMHGFYDYENGAKPAHDDDAPEPPEVESAEKIVVIGYAGLALELRELLELRYAHVELWENEDTLDEIAVDTTIVIDVGDGASDRANIIGALDSLLPAQTAIFIDAYATDLTSAARRLRHPERIAGYGIVASLSNQKVVEIADADETSDDVLELAQELFESIGHRVALIENRAGLFLGRTIGAIVNEAVCVVAEGTAAAEDVDLAMRLGTNYPQGPLAWGREIGGDRIARILQRLAASEGAAFAPHRALRILDVQEQDVQEQAEEAPADA